MYVDIKIEEAPRVMKKKINKIKTKLKIIVCAQVGI